MSYRRNQNRNIISESSDEYRSFLEKKDINLVTFFSSLTFKSDETKKNFSFIKYIWKSNDRLYRLAQNYYNDPKLWWVIAHANQKPTDAHFTPGDEIIIPEPSALQDAIKYLGY